MAVTKPPVSRTFKLQVSTQPARVCLIQPSTLTSADAYGLDVVPPLGLAYVASALKTAGHHVTFVDGVGEALERYGRASGYEGLLIHGLSLEEIIERIDPHA